MSQKVGVLALQGGYSKHYDMLKQLGVDAFLVRTASELNSVDRLIIPGGESTALLNIIHKHDLWDDLSTFIKNKPVFGTCAGSILLSKGDSYFNAIDVDVKRNAYGSQINSFVENICFNDSQIIPAVFIRAPMIVNTGENVEILAKYQDQAVLARENNILVSTFHPELTSDFTIHQYFLTM